MYLRSSQPNQSGEREKERTGDWRNDILDTIHPTPFETHWTFELPTEEPRVSTEKDPCKDYGSGDLGVGGVLSLSKPCLYSNS